ncbi:hypothetical protein BJ973_002796 [Actinoplanes tereljensis]
MRRQQLDQPQPIALGEDAVHPDGDHSAGT